MIGKNPLNPPLRGGEINNSTGVLICQEDVAQDFSYEIASEKVKRGTKTKNNKADLEFITKE
jgi:hypothetical protein